MSGFERAAVMSIDGFGDFASTTTGLGEGTGIDVRDRTLFPHSMGIVYTTVCQFIGYDQYGDEGKVMGVAPTARTPTATSSTGRAVLEPGGRFRLNLEYFVHHTEGVDYSFDGDGRPQTVAPLYSPAFVRQFVRAGLATELTHATWISPARSRLAWSGLISRTAGMGCADRLRESMSSGRGGAEQRGQRDDFPGDALPRRSTCSLAPATTARRSAPPIGCITRCSSGRAPS